MPHSRHSQAGFLCALACLSACTIHGRGADSQVAGNSVEQDVAKRLVARAREAEGRDDAVVKVDFVGCLGAPVRALLLHTEGHADAITLLELDMRSSALHARIAQVLALTEPSLTDVPPKLEGADVTLESPESRNALTEIWLAARARLEIADPNAPDGEIVIRPLRMTSRDHSYALTVQTDRGESCVRMHHGYGSNLDAPEQVPLELAWEVMYRLAPEPQPTAASDAMLDAVADAWPARNLQPEWQVPRLLALGAALPSQRLIAHIMPELDASKDEIRVAAVNALAVASGRDLRRRKDGTLASLAEIVSAYRAALGP